MQLKEISAVILTRDGFDTIQKTIQSLRDFGEIIIIIDGRSSQITKLIGLFEDLKTKGFTIYHKIIEFYNFSQAKNEGITLCTGKYIIIVDDDEFLEKNLIDELENKKLSHLGYNIRFKEFMRRKYNKYGNRGTYHTRLVKKGIYYEGKVHEKFRIGVNEIGVINKGFINHYSHVNINKTIQKFNLYTEMEVENSKIKNIYLLYVILIISPAIQFIIKYIFKMGFLEGINGFISAVFRGMYEFIKYSKIIEKKKKGCAR